MKSESEIRRQLEEVYQHRLAIRLDRYTKPMCRNCVNGVNRDFDLGDFGVLSRWECKNGLKCCDGCGFGCKWTPEQIEEKLLEEISDPAICGAKEPKIAALLWVLHNSGNNEDGDQGVSSSSMEKNRTFWEKVKGILFE